MTESCDSSVQAVGRKDIFDFVGSDLLELIVMSTFGNNNNRLSLAQITVLKVDQLRFAKNWNASIPCSQCDTFLSSNPSLVDSLGS